MGVTLIHFSLINDVEVILSDQIFNINYLCISTLFYYIYYNDKKKLLCTTKIKKKLKKKTRRVEFIKECFVESNRLKMFVLNTLLILSVIDKSLM